MTALNTKFEIDCIDHVAIRVKNMQVSVAWYEQVLGLHKYQMPEWGDYPIFMLAKKSGVALFPARLTDNEIDLDSKNVKIDHFAFNLTKENFEKAKKRYLELNLDFKVQDHHYFHSIYTRDPDGHIVELTTILVPDSKFYGK